MEASNLGRLMLVATDYGSIVLRFRGARLKRLQTLRSRGRTEQIKNVANVGGGLPATAINQSSSTGQAGIVARAPAAEDGIWERGSQRRTNLPHCSPKSSCVTSHK